MSHKTIYVLSQMALVLPGVIFGPMLIYILYFQTFPESVEMDLVMMFFVLCLAGGLLNIALLSYLSFLEERERRAQDIELSRDQDIKKKQTPPRPKSF